MRRSYFLFAFILLAFDAQLLTAMSKVQSRIQITSQSIGVKTLRYEDPSRSRPVCIELWYPTDRSGSFDQPSDAVWIHPKEMRDAPLSQVLPKYPLILMSHGHRGDRRDRSWLADQLVRQGYLVASVEHYGNTWSSYNPLLSLRFWDRALDVSFALDCLLKESVLSDRVDRDKIGFVGYSLGGMTGLALAGAIAKNVRDVALSQQENYREIDPALLEQFDFSEAEKNYGEPRIKAILLICPAIFVYPPETLKAIKTPVGLVATINDEVLPYHEHAYQIIKYLVPRKLKMMRKEISHYAFLNRISDTGRKILSKALQSDPPCCDRTAIHSEVGTFAIDFFKETLNQKFR